MDTKQLQQSQEDDNTGSNCSEKETSSSGASSSGWNMMIGILKTTVLCAVFMFVGPALILLNKYIMQSLSFPYPMFLSGLGVLTSYLFARLLIALDFAQIEKKSEVEGARFYTRVLPVGIAHAGTLATGNWVYLLLDVGFIQMLKSFTPVVVMIFLFLTNIEIPTRPVVVSILIISFGTAMTCSFTPNASVAGMAVMLLSEGEELAEHAHRTLHCAGWWLVGCSVYLLLPASFSSTCGCHPLLTSPRLSYPPRFTSPLHVAQSHPASYH